MIYSVIAMVSMMAIGSLAVDVGRVQLAKSEMQAAVDAAARAATAYLPSDPTGARTAAINLAYAHTVDGRPFVLNTSDVEIGKWNAGAGTLDTSSPTPDAVRITGHRTAARGNPIMLTLGKVAGVNSLDVRANCTALGISADPGYGIVGLQSVTMNGSSSTGTCNSSTNVRTTGVASNDGSVASNGAMSFNGSASIGGTIYYRTASAPSGGNHFDAKVRMSADIPTPATPSPGGYATSNSNPNIGLPTSGGNYELNGSSTYNVPEGTYVIDGLTLNSSSMLQFTGVATIYLRGNVALNGSSRVIPFQGKAENLTIKICGNHGIQLNSSAELTAVVENPAGAFTGNGSSRLTGSIIARTLALNSSASIHYDNQLGANGGSSETGTVSVVR